jgi:hypothetical protein
MLVRYISIQLFHWLENLSYAQMSKAVYCVYVCYMILYDNTFIIVTSVRTIIYEKLTYVPTMVPTIPTNQTMPILL